MNNILNQIVKTKQVRFTTFTIIILDNNIFKICLVQQDKWKTNQNMIAMINHQCAIQIKFHDHFSVAEKTGHSRAVILAMRYFGHAFVAVAVVERFKQESVYRLSTGIKGVAVVERWPLVEVRLYFFVMRQLNNSAEIET